MTVPCGATQRSFATLASPPGSVSGADQDPLSPARGLGRHVDNNSYESPLIILFSDDEAVPLLQPPSNKPPKRHLQFRNHKPEKIKDMLHFLVRKENKFGPVCDVAVTRRNATPSSASADEGKEVSEDACK